MRATLGAVLLVAVSAAAAGDDKKDVPIDGKKLVGKWQSQPAVEGPPRFVLEFTAGGKLTVSATKDGKEMTAEGTYKLDGTKLVTRLKVKDAEQVEESVVTRLTDDELVTEDSKGGKQTFLRVRGK